MAFVVYLAVLVAAAAVLEKKSHIGASGTRDLMLLVEGTFVCLLWYTAYAAFGPLWFDCPSRVVFLIKWTPSPGVFSHALTVQRIII